MDIHKDEERRAWYLDAETNDNNTKQVLANATK